MDRVREREGARDLAVDGGFREPRSDHRVGGEVLTLLLDVPEQRVDAALV
jgi:hypothetical protein